MIILIFVIALGIVLGLSLFRLGGLLTRRSPNAPSRLVTYSVVGAVLLILYGASWLHQPEPTQAFLEHGHEAGSTK